LFQSVFDCSAVYFAATRLQVFSLVLNQAYHFTGLIAVLFIDLDATNLLQALSTCIESADHCTSLIALRFIDLDVNYQLQALSTYRASG
jgi:hypothetical protein